MATLGPLSIHNPEDINTGVQRLDIIEDARAAFDSKGLVRATKPSDAFTGFLPPMSTLTDAQLSELLGHINNWIGYAEEVIAECEIQLKVAEEQLEFLQSSIRIALRATEEKLTVQDKADIGNTDKRIVAAKNRSLYCYAVHTQAKAVLNRANKAWETISREVTQRGQGIVRSRREENVGNIPTSPIRSPFRR